jgi:hypothetical protein
MERPVSTARLAAMKKGLTVVGQVIYGGVMVVGVLADLALLVWLFASGHGGWGVADLLFGSWLIPSIAHLLGLALAAPFAVAGHERKSG